MSQGGDDLGIREKTSYALKMLRITGLGPGGSDWRQQLHVL